MPTLRELLQYETWIMVHIHMNSDAKLYPAQIARDLGLSEVSMHRSLKRLENDKLVKMQKLGPLHIYQLTDSGNKHAEELTKFPGVVELYNYIINP